MVITSQERKQGCSESSGVLAKSGKGEAGSLQSHASHAYIFSSSF